jgi:hypothetical protein
MRICVTLFLLACSGCTAVKSSTHLVQAEQAVTRAEQRNADDDAVYEFTMAMRYLEKAREENGYADYKDSTNLSKAAAEWAEKAVSVVEMGGSDYRPPPPPPTTLPSVDEADLPDGSDDELAPADTLEEDLLGDE